MQGRVANRATQRTRRWNVRIARSALAAGFIFTTLAAGAPLFGQAARPAGPAPAPVRPANGQLAPRVATNTTGATGVPTGNEQKVMARVNQEDIGRQELATECLRRYGEEVLETLVNRHVISHACQQRNVVITKRDVDDEITRLAKKFKIPKDRWLAMLAQERGITEQQYRDEIIWPTLALRALASSELVITPDELQQGFEAEYGPKVKARIITVKDESKAQDILAKVQANPAQFGEYAKNLSEDPNSASAHGLIPPVSMHVGDPEIWKMLFAMKEGEISPIVFVGGRYHILKCDKQLEATLISSQNLPHARQMLEDKLHDEKLRAASAELFKQLQQEAKVVNVYNDPQLRQQYPGVAAQINGQPLTIAKLSDECINRHGSEVLEGEINRKILMQELKRKNQQITQEDLDVEIERAAINYGYQKADGTADLAAWQKALEQNDGATVDLYVRDAVWPSVALKKILGDSIQVTEADMKKGFEANYGERAEVLAMVLNEQREAQKVWEMAREVPSEANFGKLAEQYSVDPISRGNNGRVPPIRRHSGQKLIEDVAFKLKPGELSGIVAVEGKFVILHCIGRTKPVVTDFESVKEELFVDLREKKLRTAMAMEFQRLKEDAHVDNYITGTLHVEKASRPSQVDRNVIPASGIRTQQPRAGSVQGK
jgi:parvulin-like peptidyl-prolyl isomerase